MVYLSFSAEHSHDICGHGLGLTHLWCQVLVWGGEKGTRWKEHLDSCYLLAALRYWVKLLAILQFLYKAEITKSRLSFLRPWRVYEKALNKARCHCSLNAHKARASTQFSPLVIVVFLLEVLKEIPLSHSWTSRNTDICPYQNYPFLGHLFGSILQFQSAQMARWR